MNFKTHGAALSATAAALLVAFACAAQAQQTAPAPATANSSTPAAPPVAIPAMQCEKPADSHLADPTAAHLKRLQKEVEQYKVCVNDYAHAMGAKANEFADQSRAYATAANGAIESYNTLVTELNAKAKGDGGAAGASPSSGNASKPKY